MFEPDSTALPPVWFERDALSVARDLLGARLCRLLPDGTTVSWAITEVEAYIGSEDRACHAHKGRTARTEVMFGPAGVWYVYFCYGIHWLANIVTGPAGAPAAVLLRGAGPLAGPARLTKALAVDRTQNGQPSAVASGFWIAAGHAVPEAEVSRGPRIGVDYAGPDWASRPFRLIWTKEWGGARKPRRKD